MSLLRYLSIRMHKPSQGNRARGMKRRLRGLHQGEAGHTLPAALWTLALGALIMAALFALVSTSLKASISAQGNQLEQYASDAGIEFGIWKLVNDSTYRWQVESSGGTPVTVSPSIVVNQITVDITAAVLQLGGSWTVLTSAPVGIDSGGALAYGGGDYIYTFRGGGTQDFERYSISGDSWSGLASAPGNVGAGGSLVWTGGNYLYAFQGNNQRVFWRYNISGNSWTVMRRPGGRVGAGGASAYPGSGNFIYALRGNNRRAFWRYRISNDRWNGRRRTPARVGAGGALVSTGGNDIYGLRGNNTSAFWRYNISSNNWTTLSAVPANVAAGGALAYTGGDDIYALRGNNTLEFWSYSIAGDSWSVRADAPGTVGDGGALVFTSGNDIYALRGGGQSDFWRFSASGSIFEIVSQASGYTITAQVMIDGSNVEILSWTIAGIETSPSFAADQTPWLTNDRAIFSPPHSGFVSKATLELRVSVPTIQLTKRDVRCRVI